ncbi:hypothetical protein DKG71_42330 (plasmid) [Streptomyces sp. NEAU-S7GS2]|nr:hypothetical protein DKG71_42330 [Streptomyces sp. NEAU-S7GS2]
MAALRDWSTPGRRAELVAAAWLAGETTISALAEAARTTRPTVYADLRASGIDPDQRPKETTDMTPVVIDGLTGLDNDADGRAILNALHRYAADNPAGRGIVEFEGRFVHLQGALRIYNTLRPLLAAEERSRLDRDRALHQVEIRWEALSTAANWMAAHHAYVVAVDQAGAAIDAWCDTVTAAAKSPWFRNDGELEAYEERILGAGHPPVDQTYFADNERNELRRRLEATHARRKALAAQTLGLAEAGTR